MRIYRHLIYAYEVCVNQPEENKKKDLFNKGKKLVCRGMCGGMFYDPEELCSQAW